MVKTTLSIGRAVLKYLKSFSSKKTIVLLLTCTEKSMSYYQCCMSPAVFTFVFNLIYKSLTALR